MIHRTGSQAGYGGSCQRNEGRRLESVHDDDLRSALGTVRKRLSARVCARTNWSVLARSLKPLLLLMLVSWPVCPTRGVCEAPPSLRGGVGRRRNGLLDSAARGLTLLWIGPRRPAGPRVTACNGLGELSAMASLLSTSDRVNARSLSLECSRHRSLCQRRGVWLSLCVFVCL